VSSSPSVIPQATHLSTGKKSEEKHDVMVNCLLGGELNSVEVTQDSLHPTKNREPYLTDSDLVANRKVH